MLFLIFIGLFYYEICDFAFAVTYRGYKMIRVKSKFVMNFWGLFDTKYSRMDQVKFVEDNL